jgi:hypothetical protein
MEDSAIHHENRVSYLLGQHDLDMLKQRSERKDFSKKTNGDSSSVSTAGQIGPSPLLKRHATRDADDKKRSYLNAKNMAHISSTDKHRDSRSPGISDKGTKDKKGLRKMKTKQSIHSI